MFQNSYSCKNQYTFPRIDFPDTGCFTGDVRLTYRAQGGAEGNVEICSGDQWQAACRDSFTEANLNVTCRTLGFNEYETSQFLHELVDPIVNSSVPTLEDPFPCFGNEPSLFECILVKRRKRQVATCNPDLVVRVLCQCKLLLVPPPPPYYCVACQCNLLF